MLKENLKDYIVILFLLSVSILVYLYELIPNVQIWETDFFNIDSYYFQDVSFLAWIFLTKLSVLLILLVWFLTNSHWWRFVLTIPIVIEFYKIYGLLNTSKSYYDEDDYLVGLPILFFIIILLAILIRRIHYYSKSIILLNTINAEIDITIDKIYNSAHISKKDLQYEFELLKKRKQDYQIDNYIEELLKLRDKVIRSS